MFRRQLDIELDVDEVVVGETITGRVSSRSALKADVIWVELRHSDPSDDNDASTFGKMSIDVPGGVLLSGQSLPFQCLMPTWAAPSNSSNVWWVWCNSGRSAKTAAAAPVRVCALLPGSTVDHVGAANAWASLREHWGMTRRKHCREGHMSFPKFVLISSVMVVFLVFLFVIGAYGPALFFGLVFAVVAKAMLNALSATEESDERGAIQINGVPQVAESGENLVVSVTATTLLPITVTLRCTAWRYMATSGGDEFSSPQMTHSTLYERHVIVAAGSRVELKIPENARPSVLFKQPKMSESSAIQWDLRAQHGEDTSQNVVVDRAHLIVIARDHHKSSPKPPSLAM